MIVRAIEHRDDVAVANIIRTVMPQFGAHGPGFALHDPEVDTMYAEYNKPRSAYLVVDSDGVVTGGGGVAPLAGGDATVCELKKMYFLDVARGHGLGERVLSTLIERARGFGYAVMYLETLTGMDRAMKLYRKLGFVPSSRRGATGHFGCDHFFELPLTP